jgi:Family of unknown function (DUF6498)
MPDNLSRLGSLAQQPKPWWIPFFSLFIILHGILILHWDLQPIIFMFWWEVILMVGAALIRMVFALNGQPVQHLILQKIFLLMGSIVMGGVMIMFAIVFSFNAFQEGDSKGLSTINIQTNTMTAGYIVGLIFHYFRNGQYKTAEPWTEMIKTFVHLLVMLAFLMVITMHLLPAFPAWNKAKWVAIAVVIVKFCADWLFTRVNLVQQITTQNVTQNESKNI